MSLMKLAARLWFGNLTTELSDFGKRAEAKIFESIDTQPLPQFENLLDLKDLKGDSTGYVKSVTAEKIDRLASLSIDIAPGMRYFNIHIIPDHHYKIPRYSFEGMVTTKGSLLSTDLYPDIDSIMEFEFFEKYYGGIGKVYDKAKKHKQINFVASRLPHMRMMCSPYFLRAGEVPQEALTDFEDIALKYFDEWLTIYNNAPQISEQEAEDRLKRRQHIARTIQEKDPDRNMVVKTYGEETTLAIEKASFL